MLSMLMRYYGGERRVWAVARIPTPEQEDDRRLHRELERLRHERTAHTSMAFLARLAGIGTGSAWTLVRELFGWRQFHNRRELAGCLGLTPTPYASGTSDVEQGISKAGNKRCRWLMVELAWSWLRLQHGSQLSHWFNERFGGGGKRMRRIGIVALARRLASALWRFLEYGEIPEGAILKSGDVKIVRV